jgi:hypothetical protein
MKHKIISLMIMGTISIFGDGNLKLKGFHHDIPFESACKILSSFKTQRGNFIIDKKHHKCGFGRNGFIAQPYIVADENGNIKHIKLSPDTVDYLFNVENKPATALIDKLILDYKWLDDDNAKMVYSRYKHIDQKDGWEIIINKKKWMDIKFFPKSNNTRDI